MAGEENEIKPQKKSMVSSIAWVLGSNLNRKTILFFDSLQRLHDQNGRKSDHRMCQYVNLFNVSSVTSLFNRMCCGRGRDRGQLHRNYRDLPFSSMNFFSIAFFRFLFHIFRRGEVPSSEWPLFEYFQLSFTCLCCLQIWMIFQNVKCENKQTDGHGVHTQHIRSQ